MHASYALGWKVGIDPSGAERYLQTLEQVRELRGKHLEDLEQRLRAVSSLVEDLGRIAQQIPPVTTMIRIVITEVKIRSAELTGTADDLKVFHSHLDSKVEHMERIRTVCAKYIQELNREDR